MGEILNLIIPVIAFAIWLFSLSNKSNQEEENKPNRPIEKAPPSQKQKKAEPASAEQVKEDQNTETSLHDTLSSYQDQANEQMNEWQEKLEKAKNIQNNQKNKHDAILKETTPTAYQKKRDQKVSLSVTGQLTKKGVAQGIIMSEVLGKPRALQKRQKRRRY
ncbi:hypothetical protein [Gracilibacillus sp. YIM 98692]|uniref:hypothetical protein n=1 Tax=Gracilibacillus sp. YIM 98692 TaxID=2663532 RepID=UPI0013D316F0|nr:hypothetical protein [Gracilibacillus sp. YIM 98692]